MKLELARRAKIYKEMMKRWIRRLKGLEWRTKLRQPKVEDFRNYLEEHCPSLTVVNTARDVRELRRPGPHYDAEFDMLYRGLLIPEFIENYSETYIAKIIRHAMGQNEVSAALSAIRRRPDGRPLYEG